MIPPHLSYEHLEILLSVPRFKWWIFGFFCWRIKDVDKLGRHFR